MKSKKLIYLSNPGIVSPLGCGIEENIERIIRGEGALQKDKEVLNKQIYLGKVTSKLSCMKDVKDEFQTRTNEILLTALLQIDEEIKEAIKRYGKDRIGVIIGTTTTGIEENFMIFKNHEKTDLWDKNLYSHEKQSLGNPADFVKDFYSLSSVSYGISTACTSGAKALITAKRLIQNGICDGVICGGVDSINTLTVNGFDSLGLMSQNISNPMSKNRDGINIGEACGVFLASKDRLSSVYIAGDATNSDAFHITQPDTSAKKPIEAIDKALKEADLDSVDYINLHSTGTEANDKMEAKAFSKTLPNTPASSTKPLMGHTLAAAGAIEAAICHILIEKRDTLLPPHIFDEEFDEDLDEITLAKKGQKAKVSSALSSSFAFGGDNAILILRSDDEV